jgi:hypothetical protein
MVKSGYLMNLESAKSFLSPPHCQVTFVASNLCNCEYVCHAQNPTSYTNIKKSHPLKHISLFLLKSRHLFIYVKTQTKFPHFGKFKTNFKDEMQCQNTRIKMFDSSPTKVNMFINEPLLYQNTMKSWSTLGC